MLCVVVVVRTRPRAIHRWRRWPYENECTGSIGMGLRLAAFGRRCSAKSWTDCHVKYAVTTPPRSKTRKPGAYGKKFTTALFENTPVRKRLYSLGEKIKSFHLSLCGLKKKLQPWKTQREKFGAVEGLKGHCPGGKTWNNEGDFFKLGSWAPGGITMIELFFSFITLEL